MTPVDLTCVCPCISSVSPEIQPKFVKGSKRYGRRSTPEFIEPISDLSEVANSNQLVDEDLDDNYDSAVPRKREVKCPEFFQHCSEPPDTQMPFLSPPVLACTVFLGSLGLALRCYSWLISLSTWKEHVILTL